ncbi:hypothetical protein [Sporofaciens sp. SGI.106]
MVRMCEKWYVKVFLVEKEETYYNGKEMFCHDVAEEKLENKERLR